MAIATAKGYELRECGAKCGAILAYPDEGRYQVFGRNSGKELCGRCYCARENNPRPMGSVYCECVACTPCYWGECGHDEESKECYA
jgi:hypothetical protein